MNTTISIRAGNKVFVITLPYHANLKKEDLYSEKDHTCRFAFGSLDTKNYEEMTVPIMKFRALLSQYAVLDNVFITNSVDKLLMTQVKVRNSEKPYGYFYELEVPISNVQGF